MFCCITTEMDDSVTAPATEGNNSILSSICEAAGAYSNHNNTSLFMCKVV